KYPHVHPGDASGVRFKAGNGSKLQLKARANVRGGADVGDVIEVSIIKPAAKGLIKRIPPRQLDRCERERAEPHARFHALLLKEQAMMIGDAADDKGVAYAVVIREDRDVGRDVVADAEVNVLRQRYASVDRQVGNRLEFRHQKRQPNRKVELVADPPGVGDDRKRDVRKKIAVAV